MIVDAKIDYKARKLLLIHDTGEVEERDLVDPYFYVIVPKGSERRLEALLKGNDVYIEKDDRIPIVFVGNRYEPSDKFVVYRVYTNSPTKVPELAHRLQQLKVRIAACNLRYVIRNTFDHDVKFFGTIPLYYGFDPAIIKNISEVEALVLDVESINGTPRLVSVYRYRPFEEVRRDDVESLWLPEDTDRLQKLLNR